MTDISLKQCNRCGNLFPATKEFFALKSKDSDLLIGRCRLCENKRLREIHRKNREKAKADGLSHSDAIRAAAASGYYADLDTGVIYSKAGKPLSPYIRQGGRVQHSFFLSEYSKFHPVQAHRFIAYLAFGDSALFPGTEVHHINGDPSDNRAQNLQILTVEEHRKLTRETLFCDPPVRWNKKWEDWELTIRRRFSDEATAIKAREAALKAIERVINGEE